MRIPARETTLILSLLATSLAPISVAQNANSYLHQLSSPDPPTRTIQTAYALGQLKSPSAIQPLKAAYQRWNTAQPQRQNATSVALALLQALQSLGNTDLMIRTTGSLTP